MFCCEANRDAEARLDGRLVLVMMKSMKSEVQGMLVARGLCFCATSDPAVLHW